MQSVVTIGATVSQRRAMARPCFAAAAAAAAATAAASCPCFFRRARTPLPASTPSPSTAPPTCWSAPPMTTPSGCTTRRRGWRTGAPFCCRCFTCQKYSCASGVAAGLHHHGCTCFHPPPCRMLLSKKYGCANVSFTHDPMSVIASSNKVGSVWPAWVGIGCVLLPEWASHACCCLSGHACCCLRWHRMRAAAGGTCTATCTPSFQARGARQPMQAVL